MLELCLSETKSYEYLPGATGAGGYIGIHYDHIGEHVPFIVCNEGHLQGSEQLRRPLPHMGENMNGSVSCLVRTLRRSQRRSGCLVRHISVDVVS